MKRMKKITIQLIGNYYVRQIENYLSKDKFVIQNSLFSVSPLTLCGFPDLNQINEWETKICDQREWKESSSKTLYIKQSQALFDLKKNFYSFLSRNIDDYCDNTVFYALGKEVIYQNNADYIIIDNSSLVYDLIKYNKTYYTLTYPSTPFLECLKKQSDSEIITPYCSYDINWKFYFDMFIDAILDNYDSSNIILIKTPYSEFYNNNCEIQLFEPNKNKAKFIKEMDNYFVQKTGCMVIDTLCGKIPNRKVQCAYEYGNGMEGYCSEVANEVEEIIFEGQSRQLCISKNYNSFIAYQLSEKIKSDEFNALIDYAERRHLTSWNKFFNCDEDFTTKFLFLKDFFQHDESLCDYIRNNLLNKKTVLEKEIDFCLIEKYTELLNCDINDIISVYMLYNILDCKSRFKKIAENICSQIENPAVKLCNQIIQKNINKIKNYEFIEKKFVTGIRIVKKKYLHICESGYLIIDPESDMPFELTYEVFKNDINVEEIIKNNCTCDIQYADALTYSYKYYAEKSRQGMGKAPTYLNFDTKEAFYDSILYADYKGLLENEKFVFIIENNKYLSLDNYTVITNIDDLFDPNVVTVKIRAGLGDQTGRYMLGQMIEKYSGRKVIYADLENDVFNGIEIYKIIKKDADFLSKRLSKRLAKPGIFKNLYINISTNFVYIHNSEQGYQQNAKGCSHFFSNSLSNYIYTKIPYSYYDCTWKVFRYKAYFDFNFRDYIEFPPFEKRKNIECSKKMSLCDAVVMQIRRGDFVTLGWDTDLNFYSSSVESIMRIPQYKNLKFFIFSDDIPWCKNNIDKLGLKNNGDCEIVFVDWNKGEDCYRDIQLMALGKIMICSNSSFANIAALYNERCEMFLCSDKSLMQNYENSIKKNKYDIIGEFSEGNNVNSLKQIPKTLPPQSK